MASIKERQRFLRYYKEVNHKTDVDMHEVARLAEKMGWKLPVPPTGLDLLAKKFCDAARDETRIDKETKRPYRANLAIAQRLSSGKQQSLWIDTDEAPRHKMVKALHLYREQMVGEAIMGSNTAAHWNSIHPDQRPLKFATDLTPDKNWRENAPGEDDKAS